MSPSYEIECPNYKTGCDIENCPRLLENVEVEMDADGELVGSGFCSVKGGRYFGGIGHEKTKVLAGESPKMKEEREKISQMSEPVEKRTALLLDLLKRKLQNAPDKEAASALASWDTAVAAILLYDAEKEIAGNREKHLCGLFFCQFLISAIDKYFAIIDAAEFYAGARQIDIHDTPALRMAVKGGFIDEIDSAKKSPANMMRGYLQSGVDNRVIELAFSSLDSLLRSLCHADNEKPFIRWDDFGGFFYQFTNTATNEEMFGPNPAADIDDFKEELGRISLLFKNLQTTLRLREHEVYDLHPEWEVLTYISKDKSFHAEKDRQNQSAALRGYYEKFGNPLGRFEMITAFLLGQQDETSAIPAGSDPRPFLTPTSTSQSWDYSAELEALLIMPIRFSYESPDNVITSYYHESTVEASLNPWLADAKLNMCTALVSFCRERAKCLSKGGKANDRWMRAIAELLSSRRNGEEVITLSQEQSKTFMNAVNDAAKEEWIECRTDGAQTMEHTGNSDKKPKRKRKVKGGRPKSQDKEDQVNDALIWLKKHPGKTPPQAADYIYGVDEVANKYPDGYKRPPAGTKSRDDSFVKAIYRALRAQPKAQ